MHLQGVLVEDRHQDTILYAGNLDVRITDWFFLKKNIELKYVGLENAIIKFQRTDSVWSQQFLIDYFSSPSTGQTKKEGIHLDLKKLEFKNVALLKKDGWLGEDMTAQIGQLSLEANKLNLSGKTFDINSVIITDPVFTLNNYKKLKPFSPAPAADPVAKDVVDSLLQWNRGGMLIKIGELKIKNGIFRAYKQTGQPILSYFDGQHIEFGQINTEMTALQLKGDTLYTSLHLSAKERSGLEIKNMLADVKMTPQSMAFSNLTIQTNHSVIKNFFSMSYADLGDMDDFIHKIKMTGNFDSSEIDSDDIAFFAPDLKSWKKKILLKGKVRGAVDDLVGRDMIIQAGTGTFLNGDIALTGLPDINRTFIDFKANNFQTTYTDAIAIVPAMKSVTNPDLRKIQYINFKGSFTGFIRDFVTFGTLQTNLGTVKSDLNMKLPQGQEPVYSGNVATDNFQLGEFLGDKNIGTVSLTGSLKGKGFNEKSRNTTLDGVIHFADYNNYRYSNITVKGKLDKKLFDGVATIADDNAGLTLNGIINFNSKIPTFDLLADIKKLNLKNLNLSKDSITFKGKLNIDFTGTTIDNFLGTAKITDGELTKDGKQLPFDFLSLSSAYVDSVKTLTASSNEFEGAITGNFNINDLPDAFQLFLTKYYPSYINPPNWFPENESFHFDITTKFVEDYIKLLDTSITGFNYSHLYGDLNSGSNSINLHADVPQFKYKLYNFDDVKLLAKGNFDSLSVTGEARNININDSLNIPLTSFKINSRNDSSKVSIYTGANQKVQKADLNALLLSYNDGVKIKFDPSTFTINTKTWSIDETGVLVFRSRNPSSGELILREGEQKIMLKTQPSANGNWNDLKVELTKINIGDFSPFFLPKNRLEGLVSGNILAEDMTHDLKITSNDIQTEFLRLDNDSLGEIRASLVYDNIIKKLKVKGNTLNQENYLGFDADLFFADPVKSKNNIIALKARSFQIKILERFLGNLFSDMQGFLTGDINLKGEFDELSITGKGRLKDAGLKVNFTKCFYRIQDTDIELTPTEINLDGIILIDTATHNPIYVTGGIQHESFMNMFYDLYISTRKPKTTGDANNRPVLLLNTSFNDNKQFYGRVKGTGSFSLAGPQSDMFMKIDAIASKKDSSNITIPSSNSRESGVADFLLERKYGREMSDIGLHSATTNIIYDIDVTATPLVSVRVVLDDLTGDEIKGKGSGNLNIKSGSSEPLSIRGRYDITEGNYLFTFQSFFKKPFVLKKGSNNYIEWSGDPYKANIHFDAEYKAERISFAPLANSLPIDPGIAKARGDVYVVVSLTDELFKPTIKFSLDFPSTSVAVTDPGLALVIQQIQKNTNEINRQVTYLIVFNSFAPSELGSSNTGSGLNLNLNTISGIFLGVISDQFNKLLGKLLKNEKYSININTSLYNRNIIDPNNKNAFNLGSNVNFSIGRSFFSDRFIISTGIGFDAPLQQSTIQQSVQLLPDVTMEWLINQSGTIRASFFYRENTDYLTTTTGGLPGKARRYGTSLSYRKDFDRLGDIFKRKKSKKAPLPPVQEPIPVENKDGNVPKPE